MAEFEVTYGFNVRRFIRHTIEAETPEQAVEIARAQAREKIEAEAVSMTNTSGFGDHEAWDASMFVDVTDPALDMDVVFEGQLPELDA